MKIANLAQIVNVIAPILTRGDDLLIQSIYHPFRMFSDRRNLAAHCDRRTGRRHPQSRARVAGRRRGDRSG